MIVDKKLDVSGRRKADIVIDLRENEFWPFPKKKQVKESGETEETLDDPDADIDGNDTDFDYLLGMPIYNLTKEKVCIFNAPSTF